MSFSFLQSNYDAMVKVLMIGDSGVGKTCIIQRYTKNDFSMSHLSTIAIDFKMVTLDVNNMTLKMQIWDTAGQERFDTLTTGFFKDSDGIMITYSITDRSSFEKVNKWLNDIYTLAPANTKIILVGNKSDLDHERQVTFQEGADLAEENQIKFIETSAKTGSFIREAFLMMGKVISERLKTGQKSEKDAANSKVVVTKKSSNCCSRN